MKIQGNSGFAASRQLRRMKATCIGSFLVALTLCIGAVPLFSAPKKAVADGHYGKLRLAFEPNVGQSDPQAKFLARADGYTLFLTGSETVFLLKAQEGESNARTQRGSALRLRFLNASATAPIEPSEQLVGKTNYFIGSNPKEWHSGVATFGKLTQRGVYPGVDVMYYGNQKQLEYDFIVAPGANPREIELVFAGERKLKVDAHGNLVISTAAGEVRMRQPLAYQDDARGNRQIVAASYTVRGTHGAGISVGKYDKGRPLVIDPILEYSTYLGGSNIDGANAIAVALDKTAFVAGGTFSADFPTAHPLQPNHRLGPW